MESSEFTITIQEQFESFEIGTSDANSSTSALSAVRLRETPVPPRTASTTTPFNTGHLDSLISEQREALLQLWGLVFDQLGQPFDATVASSGALKRKTSQVREEMLKNLRQSQVEVHRQTRFGLDGQESAAPRPGAAQGAGICCCQKPHAGADAATVPAMMSHW